MYNPLQAHIMDTTSLREEDIKIYSYIFYSHLFFLQI